MLKDTMVDRLFLPMVSGSFSGAIEKEEHMLQIYVIGIDGKNEVAATDTTGVNWGPYWHPSKPYIIWSGADHSTGGRRITTSGLPSIRFPTKVGFPIGESVRVTDNVGADVLPVFSPDGKQLMWTSTRTDTHATSQLFYCGLHLAEKSNRNQLQRIDTYAGYSGKTTHFLWDSVIQETSRKKAVSTDGACADDGIYPRDIWIR